VSAAKAEHNVASKASDNSANGEVLRVLKQIEAHLAVLRDGVPGAARRWLTLDEAADELRLSRDTVERLITSGQLQAAELSTHAGRGLRRRYRIRRDWLEAYLLDTVRVKTRPGRTRQSRRASNGRVPIDFIG